MSYINRPTN